MEESVACYNEGEDNDVYREDKESGRHRFADRAFAVAGDAECGDSRGRA